MPCRIQAAPAQEDRTVSRLDITQRPMTPEQAADYCGCSANHIRNLIKRGELRAYRLGRLLRITQAALEEYEQCHQTIASGGSTEGSPSLGGRAESGDVIVLTHAPERTRREKQST